MHRIDEDGNVDNKFSEGDPQTGQPATRVGADWLNAVQEEIAKAIEGAGVALDKEDNEQLAKVLAPVYGMSALPGGGISVPVKVVTHRVDAQPPIPTSDHVPIFGVGGGEKPGVVGIGGVNGGPGVQGLGFGSGPGGYFSGQGQEPDIEGGGPGVVGLGGGTEPGGRFSAESGLAVKAEWPDADAIPARGSYYIPGSPQPSTPQRGDFYRLEILDPHPRDAELWYFDGDTWVPVTFKADAIRLHVLGEPGEPSLHSDWSAYDDVSFYWDGRRVWFSGRVSRGAGGTSELIFTLPEAFRPEVDVWLPTIHISGQTSAEAIVVHADGRVRLEAVTGTVSMLLLDGLSFHLPHAED